jgi:hypothetical protein
MNNDDDDLDSVADDAPLDPAAMLALAEHQQRAVGLSYAKPVAFMLLIWGIAWLVGFLLLWSGYDGGNPWFTIPLPTAGWIFGALIIISIVVSGIVGTRIGRGVRGASDFQGAVYGISWSLTGIAFASLGVGLVNNGMSPELASIYFPSAYALMAGVMYLAGAALWGVRSQLVLGALLLLMGSVAPFFGAPTNNLVMAIGGGGGFLAAAGWYWWRLRQEAR